jgi:nucleoside-diphosphate-sugar epimerase
VTGCAGFIGSHLVERLLDAGHSVVGVDCFTDFYPRRLKERNLGAALDRVGFSLVEADVADLTPAFLEGVTGVFHLAAQPGVRTSWGEGFDVYVQHNLLATQRLFDACATAGVRTVFASSSSVYGEAEGHPTREDAIPRPVSPYGVTKLACEQLAFTYGAGAHLNVVSLRYFSVYGPRQRPDMAFCRLVRAVLDRQAFPLIGDGRQVRDFTYVGDVVRATMLAMDRGRPGAVYNVGGGTPVALADAIEICQRLAGRRVRLRRAASVPGDPRTTSADTRRIRRELGWRPETALEDGLALQLDAEVSGSLRTSFRVLRGSPVEKGLEQRPPAGLQPA